MTKAEFLELWKEHHHLIRIKEVERAIGLPVMTLAPSQIERQGLPDKHWPKIEAALNSSLDYLINRIQESEK